MYPMFIPDITHSTTSYEGTQSTSFDINDLELRAININFRSIINKRPEFFSLLTLTNLMLFLLLKHGSQALLAILKLFPII